MQKPFAAVRLLVALLFASLIQLAPRAHATELHLPLPKTQSAPSDPLPARPTSGYVYTIQAGDTLWEIALAHRLTLDELFAANDVPDPQSLHPGDRIFVPAKPVQIVRSASAPARPQTASPAAAAQAAPAQPVPAPTLEGSALSPEMAAWPAEILAFINQKRVERGVTPLAWSAELAKAAQAHADDCQQRGWGSHEGSDGARLRTRLARIGYNARWSGENWANARSPQQALAMWWNEPPGADPHRSNMLNPMYREIGIGIVAGPWGYYFFTDFGSR